MWMTYDLINFYFWVIYSVLLYRNLSINLEHLDDDDKRQTDFPLPLAVIAVRLQVPSAVDFSVSSVLTSCVS
jgi:hypothetical protein